MSTQSLTNEPINAPELAAQQQVEKTEQWPVTIILKGTCGEHAIVGWKLREGAAIGPEDAVQVSKDGQMRFNQHVTGLEGEFDSGVFWGPGLTASYWSQNTRDGGHSWRQLAITPATT